ncbi:EF-hand domain-containing protein [Bradyrhizobium australiense]|uniref:EF-hand domain-containing protein n=1 Tax=Bradyrhizobium australiense TaxID=2721161 RepID=A0A7Y4GP27_9BRAD|nr:EF-hand domain-containing protein [Bradyrhizobium australiense]NOJ39355.1 EF-hand domain-containing protein [Bradyrhizobium australiense]
MKKTVRVLGVTISALVLAYGTVGAMAQPQSDQQAQSHSMDQEEGGTTGQGGMGQGGMMCGGMMGRGMMGRGMMGGGMMGGHMGSPMMFRMMFALMDDGDGQISLQEFQAAHERIFKAMDSNKDGQVTQDEMQAFMHGRSRRSASQQ